MRGGGNLQVQKNGLPLTNADELLLLPNPQPASNADQCWPFNTEATTWWQLDYIGLLFWKRQRFVLIGEVTYRRDLYMFSFPWQVLSQHHYLRVYGILELQAWNSTWYGIQTGNPLLSKGDVRGDPGPWSPGHIIYDTTQELLVWRIGWSAESQDKESVQW